MSDSDRAAGVPERTSEVTRILDRASRGDSSAAGELLPLVYEQLRALATRRMASERPDHTLQATALVHEAYARLVGEGHVTWDGRAHFYVAAAEAIRRILIDHARSRGRAKRGGAWRRVTFDSVGLAPQLPATEEIVAVDDAIQRLENRDPRAAQIVRLRFYAGLEMQQIAELLQISERTVRRDWTIARAWLYRDLFATEDIEWKPGLGYLGETGERTGEAIGIKRRLALSLVYAGQPAEAASLAYQVACVSARYGRFPLAQVYFAQGDWEKAAAYLRSEHYHDRDDDDQRGARGSFSRTQAAYGRCLAELGRYPEAESLLLQAHAITVDFSAGSSLDLPTMEQWIAELCAGASWILPRSGKTADRNIYREVPSRASGEGGGQLIRRKHVPCWVRTTFAHMNSGSFRTQDEEDPWPGTNPAQRSGERH